MKWKFKVGDRVRHNVYTGIVLARIPAQSFGEGHWYDPRYLIGLDEDLPALVFDEPTCQVVLCEEYLKPLTA